VPNDVSVVGFDDSPLAGLAHVDLTTIGQDSARLAELAVARAVGRIEDASTKVTDEVCEPRLVVRGSTGAPRLVEVG
jgi:DNA-binding LacI/PurR family transcriptional regulator